MIRAVFFDLDDTLIDAMQCHLEANAKTFRKFEISYSEIKKKIEGKDYLGMRLIEILKDMRDAVGVTEKVLPLKTLVSSREKIFLKLVNQKATLYPGARHALTNAQENGATIAVVSSGTQAFIACALKKFNLDRYVDFVVGEEDVKRGKPFPDVYEKAYRLLPKDLNISKQDCLVVEDSANGIKSAKTAGLKTVFVPSKWNSKKVRADWRLKSLKDFNLMNIGLPSSKIELY